MVWNLLRLKRMEFVEFIENGLVLVVNILLFVIDGYFKENIFFFIFIKGNSFIMYKVEYICVFE